MILYIKKNLLLFTIASLAICLICCHNQKPYNSGVESDSLKQVEITQSTTYCDTVKIPIYSQLGVLFNRENQPIIPLSIHFSLRKQSFSLTCNPEGSPEIILSKRNNQIQDLREGGEPSNIIRQIWADSLLEFVFDKKYSLSNPPYTIRAFHRIEISHDSATHYWLEKEIDMAMAKPIEFNSWKSFAVKITYPITNRAVPPIQYSVEYKGCKWEINAYPGGIPMQID